MKLPKLARRSANTWVVWMPEHIRDELVRTSIDHAPDETGGILLGYEADKAVVITGVIGAGPAAERSKSRFKPDGEWQSEQIADAYERSSRLCTYLGDWHSHPKSSPTPSASDERTARRIAEHVEARSPRPLIVIVGGFRGSWQIAAHRFSGKRLKRAQLKLCPPTGSGEERDLEERTAL